MEEIITKIIEIDVSARNDVKIIQDKKDNIETYINESLQKKKDEIDIQYSYKKRQIEEKYKREFNEKKEKLDYNQKQKLENIKETYIDKKDKMLETLLKGIILSN